MSDQTGFGYFRNFGQTRRQGFELGARTQAGRVAAGAGYTFLHATFESEERVNGESNSTNDAAEAGVPGLEGKSRSDQEIGCRSCPRHLLKLYSDLDLTSRLSVAVNVIGSGGLTARGNENDRHEPDGVYYLGEGSTAGLCRGEPGRAVPVDRPGRSDCAGQQPVRPAIRHGGTAGTGGLHGRWPVPGEAVPSGGRRSFPWCTRRSWLRVPRFARGSARARASNTTLRPPPPRRASTAGQEVPHLPGLVVDQRLIVRFQHGPLGVLTGRDEHVLVVDANRSASRCTGSSRQGRRSCSARHRAWGPRRVARVWRTGRPC